MESNDTFSIGSGCRTATIDKLIQFLKEKKKEGFTDISVNVHHEYYNMIEDIEIVVERPYKNN